MKVTEFVVLDADGSIFKRLTGRVSRRRISDLSDGAASNDLLGIIAEYFGWTDPNHPWAERVGGKLELVGQYPGGRGYRIVAE